jgi:type IV fimbrial biogenesis protein FimT
MHKRQTGVSMIEIAVVLTIAAILVSQAAPAFNAWMLNVQIRTATESIQNGMQLARSEALRRNRTVFFWLTSANNPLAGDWMVGCATPQGLGSVPEQAGDCPGVNTADGVPAPSSVAPINWIQRQAALDQQTSIPVITPTPAAATIATFNSLGMLVPNLDGSASLTQVDVALATANAQLRPLRVVISGGLIRMCDPALVFANDPRGC